MDKKHQEQQPKIKVNNKALEPVTIQVLLTDSNCRSENFKIADTSTKSTRNLTSHLLKRHIERFEMTNAHKIRQKNFKRDLFAVVLPKQNSISVPVKMSKDKVAKRRFHQKSRTLYSSNSGNVSNLVLTKGSAFYMEANAKHREYMEDYIKIMDSFPKYKVKSDKALYIVCDGHSGTDVAKIAVERFPQIFKSLLNNDDEEHKTGFVESCITQSFRILDEELVQYEEVGSTMNIIYMQIEDNQRVIYSGNIGDSRSILVKKNSAIRLSFDHKAIDKSEIDRVKKEGGIILKKRFYGALAITRALGDYTFKIDGCGLSNIPYITRTVVEKDDQYIIMGSDGVWDVINEEKAYKFIQDNPIMAKDPVSLSKFFVEKSVEIGSKDNICCIAIKMN